MDRYLSLIQELRKVCPGWSWGKRAHEQAHHLPDRRARAAHGPAGHGGGGRGRGALCRGLGVAPFYMGNGSDLLVADRGYDGFILKAVSGLNSLRAEGNTIAAGSGVLLSRLASFAMEQGLSGLEFAHGIPARSAAPSPWTRGPMKGI